MATETPEAPTTAGPLQARADALLGAEGELDLEALAALCRTVRQDSPDSPDARDRLLTTMQALQDRARDELKSIGEALRSVRKGRRALKGYGHLRSTKTSQQADRLA